MRNHPNLRTLFQAAASLVLGASSVAGCTSSSPAADGGTPIADGGDGGGDAGVGIDRTGFDENVCDGGQYEMLTGVIATPPVDYAELRSYWDTLPGDGGAPATTIVAKSGTVCKTATDADACRAKLASLSSAAGWKQTFPGAPVMTRYLAYTRGDQVGVVTSLADLKAFVAPVDNAKDAAFLVVAAGVYGVDCARPNAKKTADGYEIIAQKGFACGEGTSRDEDRLKVTSDGTQSVLQTVVLQKGDPGCAIGRRPESVHVTVDDRSLGAYFASVGYLEAASVHAFDRLARELEAHGAPRALVDEARRAEADEVRHAEVTRALAARFGGEVRPVELDEVAMARTRSLDEIALENAVEGCVRETYGALVATFQARAATDREVREVMAQIAEDETRHAALSWDVAAWLEGRLDAKARARVEAARQRALAELRREIEREPSKEIAGVTGTPSAGVALRLLDEVAPVLWAA